MDDNKVLGNKLGLTSSADLGIVNISAVCKPPKSLKLPITVSPPLVSYML